jgi:hypothetical protein
MNTDTSAVNTSHYTAPDRISYCTRPTKLERSVTPPGTTLLQPTCHMFASNTAQHSLSTLTHSERQLQASNVFRFSHTYSPPPLLPPPRQQLRTVQRTTQEEVAFKSLFFYFNKLLNGMESYACREGPSGPWFCD